MTIHLKNILALLPDDSGYKTEKTDIYISNGVIDAIGTAPDGFTAEKTIDGEDKLVIPGLVNCHTHTYMSLFRNLADDLSFGDWLFKNIMPMEDKLTDEDAYWGAMLACVEMLKSGTTCFLDMHMFKNMTAKAAVESGMRAVISRGLVGNGRNDEGGIRRINDTREEMKNFADNDRLTFMLAPHAIYTTDAEYLSLCIDTAKELNLPLNIHLSETTNEVETAYKQYGCSPVEYLEKLGFFDVKTVAAHCVHLSDNDIEILAKHNVSVALNPMSNLKLGNGFAPVIKMQDAGINLCIGTDSAASNNTLNMFSDMNYTALVHKGTNENAQAVSANDVLGFATRNGAKALGLDNVGEIKVGMKADLAILDINRPQFFPRNNLVSALVYSANGSEVETVIVDGEIVLENGRTTLIDEKLVYAKAEETINRLKNN